MRASQSKIARAACAVALVALASACGGRGASNGARQSDAVAQQSPAQSDAGGVASAASPADVARLNEDIERLEKAAGLNPADEDTRDELAKAYVRRGDAERAGNQPQEALRDYQRALRLDPDNDQAQKGAADTEGQVGGEGEDENGAPLPPPITPNVTDDEEKPAPSPGAKPTPKKQ